MTVTLIGKHNSRLIEIRKAFKDGGLTADGLLPIEGHHLLQEARQSGVGIVELFVLEGESPPVVEQNRVVPTYALTDSVFGSITGTRNSQGVVALISPPRFDFDAILAGQDLSKALLVVLCGLSDPGNAGTILRVAEAFQATGCIATPGTVGQYNAKLVRASAGSLFRLPHVWDMELSLLAEKVRSLGFQLIGTGPDGATLVDSQNWRRPTALLIGNEAAGLSGTERELCDAVVRIPHVAHVESLNAASAAAVILYEAERQRRKGTV